MSKKKECPGSIEERANDVRITYSFGKDPVRGDYPKVRVQGFPDREAAETARQLLALAIRKGFLGVPAGPEAFAKVCEVNKWDLQGRLPGKNPDKVSVLQLSLGFLEFRRTNEWDRFGPMAYRSYYNKKKQIEKHLGEFGERNVAKVTSKETKAFKQQLQKRTNARTARDVMNVVRPAFDYAVQEMELIATSPASGTAGNVFAYDGPDTNAYGIWDENGKLKDAPPKIMLKAEYKAFFEFMKGYDMMWFVFFLVCLASGLRLGAIAGLRRSDCHLDGDTPGLWSKGGITLGEGGKWVRGKGKNQGKHSVAHCQVVLDKFTASILKAYLESDEWKRRARIAGDKGADTPVFRTTMGEFPSAGSWRKAFLAGISAIGISEKERKERDLTPNTWRHTYITEAVIRGEPLESIAERVGNTPDIIRRNYLHHKPADQARLAWNPLAT